MVYKSATNVMVLDGEIAEIRLLLERHAGALLEQPKEMLGDRIAEYVESRRMDSAADLVAALRTFPKECDLLLERLLVGDTAFFRSSPAFEALEGRALAEIKQRKADGLPRLLRIWSAGCSTGEEAYSIALTVCEALNGDAGGWNIHIVGSDIRSDALVAGERGLYKESQLANVPSHWISQYFSRVGDHFLVKPRLRSLVRFAPMNLAQPSFIGRFDCIFCMDVLPHFSRGQRAVLLQRLHMYLDPGGYLFLGENEKLPAAEVSFAPQAYLGCTYYQRPMARAAKAGKP